MADQITFGIMAAIDTQAIADLSSALLTPIIGVVTTIILINQYRLERRRWRLDLFEKRYVVYRAALEFIYAMMREGRCTEESQGAFLIGTRDRGLFFEDEIREVLDEVWKAGIDHEMHESLGKDHRNPDESRRHIIAASEIKKSLPELGRKVQEAFGRYIHLKER